MNTEENPTVGRYKKIKKIGEGSYGIVYKAMDTSNDKLVAIKELKIDKEDDGIPAHSLREVGILKTLSHSNIIKLVDTIYSKEAGRLFLVFEHMDLPLSRFLEEKKYSKLNPYLCKVLFAQQSIMFQILQGIKHLHLRQIIHRDIKPDNILVDLQTASVKIADFGLAKKLCIPNPRLSSKVQTLWYRAPELILGFKQYSIEIDIWAAGCIFFEVLNGKPLFYNVCEIGQLFNIFKVLGTPNELEWPELADMPHFKPNFPKFVKKPFKSLFAAEEDVFAVDLIARMVRLNPAERISVLDCLQHPYFAGVDCPSL